MDKTPIEIICIYHKKEELCKKKRSKRKDNSIIDSRQNFISAQTAANLSTTGSTAKNVTGERTDCSEQ